MKRILMLSQTVFPPDIRLEKEIKTLSQSGYKILVMCNQYEKDIGIDFPFCSIYRVKAIFKNKKLNKIINIPLFLNPRYLYYCLKAFINFKPDIIHAHDLPMVPIALIFKKFFGKRVIYDMHENYPQALRFFEKKGFLNFLFKNYKLAFLLDKYCINKADRIIVVVWENKERLISLGINPRKIYIVSNTIDLDSHKNFKVNNELKNKYKNDKIILYTGAISPDRGLDIPIKAMKFINEILNNVKLLIVGDGPNLSRLKILSSENKVEYAVKFIKWPGHEHLVKYWDLADVCIIPQPSNDFIDNTIPHKLFEYMYFKKPVLASDAKPLKRIIEETGAGVVFKSNNEEDFAEKAIKLLSGINKFNQNGYSAVINKYNWSNDSKVLLKLYSEFETFNKTQK